MKKIFLTLEMVEDGQVPEVKNILTPDQKKTLSTYFLNEQFEDITDKFRTDQNYQELAWRIGPEEFVIETLQHIIVALHPDKYEPHY